VKFDFDADKISIKDIEKAITNLGYEADALDEDVNSKENGKH
jgi:hypothetical protein